VSRDALNQQQLDVLVATSPDLERKRGEDRCHIQTPEPTPEEDGLK
jgi:hypothetical protein